MPDRAGSEASAATDRSGLRVLIADESDGTLAPVVAGLGHVVIAQTIDTGSAARLTAREQPDVALVSLGPKGEHALEMIREIVRERACPVVAVTSVDDAESTVAAAACGVFAVVDRHDPDGWQAAIECVLQRFADIHQLRAAFDRRAVIERANGILMERHGVAADAAFAMLRSKARDANLKVVDVASAVVTGAILLPTG